MTQRSALEFSPLSAAGAPLPRASRPQITSWEQVQEAHCPPLSLVLCVLQALRASPKPLLSAPPTKKSPWFTPSHQKPCSTIQHSGVSCQKRNDRNSCRMPSPHWALCQGIIHMKFHLILLATLGGRNGSVHLANEGSEPRELELLAQELETHLLALELLARTPASWP